MTQDSRRVATLLRELEEMRQRVSGLEASVAGSVLRGEPASEAAYRALFDSLGDPVFIWDRRSHRFLDCNRAALEHYGYSLAELREITPLQLHPRDEWDEVRRDMERPEGQRPRRYTHLRKNGERIEVELETEATELDGRRAWITVARDVTERRLSEEALEQTERRLSLILDSLPMALYTAHGDPARGTTWVSDQIDRLTGFPAERFVRDPELWTTRLHPEDRERVLAELEKLPESKQLIVEYRWQCRDGTYRWFLDHPVLVDEEGEVTGRIGTWVDITDRKQVELALQVSEEKYSKLFQHSHDAILIHDVEGRILEANRRAQALLGYDGEGWQGLDVRQLHPPAALEEAEAALEKVARDGSIRFEIDFRRSDGDLFTAEVSASIFELRGDRLVQAIVRDVTERKLSERKLQHDALHDPLTGLANRTLFQDRLQVGFDRYRRRGSPAFAVLFLDLDRFKEVNDVHGHAVGDLFLVALAQRMKEAVRPGDTVARLHGDEFTVLVSDVESVDEVIGVAERLQDKVSSPIKVTGVELRTTASIGIAMATSRYRDPREVLADADASMYRAKEQGGACHAVSSPASRPRLSRKLHLEEELSSALERGEFELLFQPVVDTRSGRVLELEALLRWRHPERGLLAPRSFLAHAEASGLLLPIGEWVLDEAAGRLADFRQLGEEHESLGVSVNLVSRQLVSEELLARFEALIERHRLSPSSLRVEVSETVVFEATLEQILSKLRGLGIQIWLDDFGAGYSSLGSLHSLPIDGVKIERSLVSSLDGRHHAVAVVRTIVAIGETIGFKVLAKGVETEAQLQALTGLDVRYVQGHLFSPPVDAAGVRQLLQASPWSEA